MKPKLDQVARDLLAAALYTERHARPQTSTVPTVHLLSCVSMSLGMPNIVNLIAREDAKAIRLRYRQCASRLFEVIGSDLADFTREGAIDALVATAYFHLPEGIQAKPLDELPAVKLANMRRLLKRIYDCANEGHSVKLLMGEEIRQALK